MRLFCLRRIPDNLMIIYYLIYRSVLLIYLIWDDVAASYFEICNVGTLGPDPFLILGFFEFLS